MRAIFGLALIAGGGFMIWYVFTNLPGAGGAGGYFGGGSPDSGNGFNATGGTGTNLNGQPTTGTSGGGTHLVH